MLARLSAWLRRRALRGPEQVELAVFVDEAGRCKSRVVDVRPLRRPIFVRRWL